MPIPNPIISLEWSEKKNEEALKISICSPINLDNWTLENECDTI